MLFRRLAVTAAMMLACAWYAQGQGGGADKKLNAAVEKLVNKLLAQMDTDKDGKISKSEAKGALATNFALFDLNKDGYLDRAEFGRVAQRRLAAGQQPLDFDALDKNADGRLTRDEVKGTAIERVFDEIDTNRDGKIDPAEFEAYLKKLAEKKNKK